MAELEEEPTGMTMEDIAQAQLVTSLQIRDMLALIIRHDYPEHAKVMQEAHAQGKLLLDLPFYAGE